MKTFYEAQVGYGRSPCCGANVVWQNDAHFCTWCQGEVPASFWVTVRISAGECQWTSKPVKLDAPNMAAARKEATRQVATLRSLLASNKE